MLRYLMVLLISTAAFAQEAAPARFLLERIEVHNARLVSGDLVRSETLLREGSEYSETDLSAASARLLRLPFLIGADFALEKGSSRGRYVLVITVRETKPFFFLIDARPAVWDDTRRTVEYDADPVIESRDAAAGFRWFVGGRSIVHVGVTSRRNRTAFTTGYSAYAIGYTRYDLFGTHAFATVNIRLPFDSPTGGLISPQVVIGVPLTANQTLTLDYEDTYFQRDTTRILGVEYDRQDAERLITLTWSYNTSNHPFVPTRGTILRVSPLRSMRDMSGYRFIHAIPHPQPTEAFAEHTNGYGVDVTAVRYWELSERTSVSAGVLAGWADVESHSNPNRGRADVAWNPTYAMLRAGYSFSLWQGDRRDGDSRIELEGGVAGRQRNVDYGEEVFGAVPPNEETLRAGVSWVRRTNWGTLRLGAGYSWGH